MERMQHRSFYSTFIQIWICRHQRPGLDTYLDPIFEVLKICTIQANTFVARKPILLIVTVTKKVLDVSMR